MCTNLVNKAVSDPDKSRTNNIILLPNIPAWWWSKSVRFNCLLLPCLAQSANKLNNTATKKKKERRLTFAYKDCVESIWNPRLESSWQKCPFSFLSSVILFVVRAWWESFWIWVTVSFCYDLKMFSFLHPGGFWGRQS